MKAGIHEEVDDERFYAVDALIATELPTSVIAQLL